MDNPLESTGLLREGQAVELFNRRDYAAAALVFEDVANKVTAWSVATTTEDSCSCRRLRCLGCRRLRDCARN